MVSEYNTIDFFPKEKLYMYTLIDIYIYTHINFIHIYINTHFVNIIHKYNKYNIYIYRQFKINGVLATGGGGQWRWIEAQGLLAGRSVVGATPARCGWASGCPPVRKKARRRAGVARESEIGGDVARVRRRGQPGAPP